MRGARLIGASALLGGLKIVTGGGGAVAATIANGVAQVGNGTASGSQRSGLIPAPTVGSLLVIAAAAACGNSDFAGWSITTPSGWTRLANLSPLPTGGVALAGNDDAVFWRIADGTSADVPTVGTSGDPAQSDIVVVQFEAKGSGRSIRATTSANSAGASKTSPSLTPTATTDTLVCVAFGTSLANVAAGWAVSPAMTATASGQVGGSVNATSGVQVGLAVATTAPGSTAATPAEVWTYNGAGSASRFAAGSFLIS